MVGTLKAGREATVVAIASIQAQAGFETEGSLLMSAGSLIQKL
jgi:hypothetical protein